MKQSTRTTAENELLGSVQNVIAETAKQAILPDIMGIEQAAQFTHLSKHTIYKKVCKRQIPFRKKGGRLYFLKKELKRWMLGE